MPSSGKGGRTTMQSVNCDYLAAIAEIQEAFGRRLGASDGGAAGIAP